MNSIHANQPEDYRQDLHGPDAVAKIRDIVDRAKTCFFCTADPASAPQANSMQARPMNVRQVDDRGSLWFLSAEDSDKNQELHSDRAVTLYFQGSPHSGFLELHGKATISRDKEKIKELWEPVLSTWFTEGIDDPRITVIQVKPQRGYYWDTKHGETVAGIKMLLGAAIGKTLDDSQEGVLTV